MATKFFHGADFAEPEPVWTVDLEYRGDGHNKFWRARVDGYNLYVNFGRIGTSGQIQVKYLTTPREAQLELVKRTDEKLSSGYKNKAIVQKDGTRKFVQPVQYYPFPPWPERTTAQLPSYKADELDKMPEGFFKDLAKRVAAEATRRDFGTLEAQNKKKTEAITGFQNFLLGCAHAMACRAALRWSAGHEPYGKAPMSGKPWNALDGAKMSLMMFNGTSFKGPTGDVKADPKTMTKWGGTRLWSNPLLWNTKGDITYWLKSRPSYTGHTVEYLH